MEPLSVLGLGDPVLDIVCNCSHEFLAEHVTQEPGGCTSVPPEEMATLLCKAQEHHTLMRIPGGSAANVMKGMANICKGSFTAHFLGMVGRDATGRDYRAGLAAQGVRPLLLEAASESPSAVALCFVTPDGQRTMRTCLGASLELQSGSQLAPDQAAVLSPGLRALHCEGYCLYRPKLAREMCDRARAAGALVSIDLASFELVRNCKASLLDLLRAGAFDIVFANEEEAAALAGELGLTDAAAAHDDKVAACQAFLLKHVQLSVVSLGPRGCVARSASGQHGASPAAGVQVVDTIGAGDTFASGFLSAYLSGGSLQQAAEAGCCAGSEAVTVAGANLPEESWQRIRGRVAQILAAGGGGGGSARAGAGEAAAAPAQVPVRV